MRPAWLEYAVKKKGKKKKDLRRLLELPRRLLQAPIALLVCATGTEANAHEGRPRAPPEQQDGKDDAEAETEGRFDEHVREATVPLLV